jgi:hypothetical protein
MMIPPISMKLNLKAALNAILRFGKSEDNDLPVSMVLLLREPRFLTLEQLRSAAERAFETSFAGGNGSKHFVMQAILFTLMKAGPHTLSFLHYRSPYGSADFPKDFLETLPKASQKRAWAEHTAWTAVDYVKSGADPELEYAVLASLCVELIDSNCTGIYVPREQSLIPNDESTKRELRLVAGSRELGVT